jgi:serine/threonine protein kinase
MRILPKNEQNKLELEALEKVKDKPNFIHITEKVETNDIYAILFPFVYNTALQNRISDDYFKNRRNKLTFMIDLVNAINTLHKLGYVHGNINLNSLSLNTDQNKNELLISNLIGISKKGTYNSNINKPEFSAPEIRNPEDPNMKFLMTNSMDIFSLGVVYYCLLLNSNSNNLKLNQEYFVEDNFITFHYPILEKDAELLENMIVQKPYRINSNLLTKKIFQRSITINDHYLFKKIDWNCFYKPDKIYNEMNSVVLQQDTIDSNEIKLEVVVWMCILGFLFLGVLIVIILLKKSKKKHRKSVEIEEIFDKIEK